MPKNGKTYGPSTSGHFYLAVGYHNPTAKPRPNKSRWRVGEGKQYELFCLADEETPMGRADPHDPFNGRWICPDNADALFTVSDGGGSALGVNDERLGYFWPPRNASDPWHGHPVFSRDRKPGQSLLERWVRQGVIGRPMRRRIERSLV